MVDDPLRLSHSVEDYLKAIHALNAGGDPASTSQIAERLEVQPASVSGMIKRLAEAGLLEHLPYRGVRLTTVGSREALRVVRRHRILEAYLHTRLGYAWEEVHEEAERLEHAVSDLLIDRMAATLGDPSHDPHGAPIPDAEGVLLDVHYPSLADGSLPPDLLIRAVGDDDPDRLRYLESKGLLPGTALTVLGRDPFQGPVTVRVDGDPPRTEVIGFDLASRIYVSSGP